MNKLHFISGLPRSGSTLLSCILRQNPKFDASIMSPLLGAFGALEGEMAPRNWAATAFTSERKTDMLRGLFSNYYTNSRPVVFDTHRGWTSKLPQLTNLFPDSKIICCVRDVSWIMDSLEKLIQSNPFELSDIFNSKPNLNVYNRTVALAAGDGMVGAAIDSLKQAYFGAHSNRLILVDYDALVNSPESTLDSIYKFIGEPNFKHDFNKITSLTNTELEFDRRAGTTGLHNVKSKITSSTRKTILPPDVFARYQNDAFWRYASMNINDVKVILNN